MHLIRHYESLFANLCILTFLCVLLITGVSFTIKLWSVTFSSFPAPLGYGYLVIPVMSIVMLKFCAASIISDLRAIKSNKGGSN